MLTQLLDLIESFGELSAAYVMGDILFCLSIYFKFHVVHVFTYCLVFMYQYIYIMQVNDN